MALPLLRKKHPVTRVLDWRSRHDPRSLDYPVRPLLAPSASRHYRLWETGPVLDQGAEGACVGHGWADEATALPVAINFSRQNFGTDDKGHPWPKDPQGFAFALYRWAQRHDEFAGENYDGTSVLAGAKGMKALGMVTEYRWATSVDDVIDTIVQLGPVVLGMDWLNGMYDAPGGELHATGAKVGGHCILAVGYDPERRWSDGSTSAAVALQNSWGPSWGVHGIGWVSVADLSKVLAKTGEACVPVRRIDPAAAAPAPEPTPTPVPDPTPRPVDPSLLAELQLLLAKLADLLKRILG